MPRPRAVFPAALLTAALLLVAGGCDLNIPGGANPGDDMDVGQTQILRVEVDPDAVAAGETARFTCVIEDSTDERFQFTWSLRPGMPRGAVTEDNTVEWQAPDEPGTYTLGVTADKSSGGTPPSRLFKVAVFE